MIELRELIDVDLEELREAFLGVTIEVFEFAYSELGDFEEADDRSAYAAITKLSYAVRKWIGETIGFLAMAEKLPVALDQSLRERCDEIADGFPMAVKLERAIRKRVLFEKSVLTRNVKAFAETKGTIEATTTPQVDLFAIQSFVKEAIEQARENGNGEYPELLELRTEIQRLTVGCGRIWKAYKESQERVERSGMDWQVKMSEAFPAALKLKKSLTLKDFEHYAKEGIRKGKRAKFEAWVHGTVL